MEKQPVDDLFTRKLRDAEVTVRDDLFSEVQKRMGAKPLPVRRRVAAWWSAASAACILVALWFLYKADRVQSFGNTPIAHEQKPVKTEPVSTDQEERLANVPELEKPVSRQETKSAVYRNQLTEVKNQSQKQANPTTQSPVEDQVSTPLPEQIEQVAVIHSQEIQQPSTSPTTLTPALIERVGERKKLPAERTIILTIDEPQMTTTLAANQIDLPVASDLPTRQNGLSGLFGKLKQLKNGEVLAKATITPGQSNQRNRFGRVFTEVKESMKNETTLD